MKANVVIVEDDPLVATHVGCGVMAHDGLSLVATYVLHHLCMPSRSMAYAAKKGGWPRE